MTTLYIDEDDISTSSVLDLVEDYLTAQEWPYERFEEEEITAVVPGAWGEVHLRYMWRDDAGLLQIAAVFEARVPTPKRAKIYEALALVNERLWLGHFELWADEGALMFRHAILVTDSEVHTTAMTEAVTHAAIKECERFYPVFQFVLWSDKSAEEAVEAAMLETMGEA
jgi:hypothetical protein